MKGQDILEGASLFNEILYYEILFQTSFIKRNPFCFLKPFVIDLKLAQKIGLLPIGGRVEKYYQRLYKLDEK